MNALETVPTPSATGDLEAAVMTFYTAVWNRGDIARIADLAHPDFTFRGSLGRETCGITAFGEYVQLVTTALGEYVCDVEELVAAAPRVFAKVLFSGIHRDPFLGMAPTGRRVEWYGAALFTFVNGKISDLWVLGDVDGLKRQLATNAANYLRSDVRDP